MDAVLPSRQGHRCVQLPNAEQGWLVVRRVVLRLRATSAVFLWWRIELDCAKRHSSGRRHVRDSQPDYSSAIDVRESDMSLGGSDLTELSRMLGEVLEVVRGAATHVQLGLGQFDAAFDNSSRAVDFVLEHVSVINLLALAGVLCHVATPLMRTMVPLRISFIFSDVFFIAYGVLSHSFITLGLYLLLLPINCIRLFQMMRLVRKARESAQSDKSINWLKPFTTQRKYRAGDVLFYKGDPANELFFTVTGKFLVTEIGVELPPGRLVGELGFLSPNNRRTMTVECLEDGEVLTITYDKLLEICFQNPEFGYYFLRVSSERLLERIAHLEAMVNQGKGPEVREAPPKTEHRPPAARGQPGDEVLIPGLSTWA
jgi:hypothetical protein